MKINVLGIVKGVTGLVASAGAGVIVGNLVKATTPYDSGKIQKVLVGVGGYTIGAVLGDLSAKYVNDQIDGYAARISEIVHPSEEMVEAVNDAKEAVSEAADEVAQATKAVVTDITKTKKEDTPADGE